VQVLEEAVHSGDASGIVPSSFRIARQLLSRLEDEATGALKLRELHVKIPRARVEQTKATAQVLKKTVYSDYRWAGRTRPMHDDPAQLLLRRCWFPTLSVTAAGGLPALGDASNVVRTATTLKLSIRLPPTCDVKRARTRIKRLLEQAPPHGALVRFEAEEGGAGWDAPALAPWLADALGKASRACFGQDPCFMGEGGSIPFMAMLGRKFPRAQFLITGVLGPHSNAHGPNEFLHLPTAKRLTACIAHVLDDHARRAPVKSRPQRTLRSGRSRS
jgi:acetylornithine deacetylase/succinyl-diaminopimelate desuccinylase-like protein